MKQAMNRTFKNKSEARAFYSSGLEGWDGNLDQIDFTDNETNVLKILRNLELFPRDFELFWIEEIWPDYDRFGSRLAFLSERLRDSKQVVQQAIRTHAIWNVPPEASLDNASERLRHDVDVLAQCLGQGYNLRWVPEELQQQVVHALLKTTFTRLDTPFTDFESSYSRPLVDIPTSDELPFRLQRDKFFLEIAIPLKTEVLKLAAIEMQDDPELRILAGWAE